MFQALVLEKDPAFRAEVRMVDDDFLPDGDVTAVDTTREPISRRSGGSCTGRTKSAAPAPASSC